MSYYLGLLNASHSGKEKYAVGVYDSKTHKANEGNSSFAHSFPEAIGQLCDYAKSHPNFSTIHFETLEYPQVVAVKSLEALLLSRRKSTVKTKK